MKYLAATLFVLAVLGISGCSTTTTRTYSTGRDFPAEQVSNIVKGRTTSAELKQMFGEPWGKATISATEEKWVYTHSSGTTRAQRSGSTTRAESTTQLKTLDVLLKDGIVINYTFTEGPMGVSVK
jgi:hypothetical protein